MKCRYLCLLQVMIIFAGWFHAGIVHAEEVRIAVATNFLPPLKEIVARFKYDTGHGVSISSGSTGKLYTQIVNGAPFDVFLAADAVHAELLVNKGFAVAGSRFIYAVGRLVLWSRDPALIKNDGAETLREKKFSHLSMANPKTAPYGKAAVQVMQALGVWGDISPLLVTGEDIGQAFQFVATKNADLGFVALSQVMSFDSSTGSRWHIPASLHDPIRQESVLLKHGESNAAALAFLEYLRSNKAGEVIERYGYGLK